MDRKALLERLRNILEVKRVDRNPVAHTKTNDNTKRNKKGESPGARYIRRVVIDKKPDLTVVEALNKKVRHSPEKMAAAAESHKKRIMTWHGKREPGSTPWMDEETGVLKHPDSYTHPTTPGDRKMHLNTILRFKPGEVIRKQPEERDVDRRKREAAEKVVAKPAPSKPQQSAADRLALMRAASKKQLFNIGSFTKKSQD